MGDVNWDNLIPDGVTTDIGGSKAVWKDADTFRRDNKNYRIRGLDADETWKVANGEMKPGQWLGDIQTKEFGKLAETMGFNNIVETGELTYGRHVADLTNDNGQTFTDSLYEQGLVRSNKWATPRQQELAERGKLSRWLDEAKATDAGVELPKSEWDLSRDRINDFKRESIVGFKGTAMNERELAANAANGDDYSGTLSNTVQFRHANQDLKGHARGVFSAGMSQGWHSIKESAAGGLQVLGDVFDSDYLTNWGEADLRELQYEGRNAPTFVQDIGKVEFGENFTEYLKGMAGVSLPYMLGIIGSAGAGAVVGGAGLAGAAIGLTAPAWVYSGEIYNNMEGDKDTKNAGAAITGGIMMAVADRLGLHAILGSGKQFLKKDAIKQLTKALAKKDGITAAEATRKVAMAQLETGKDLLKGMAGQATINLNKGLVAKSLGLGFARGAVGESVTESFQETTGFLASHFGSEVTRGDDINTDELGSIALNAAVGGFLLGGGISGSLNAKQELMSYAQTKYDYGQATKDAADGMLDGTLDSQMDDILKGELNLESDWEMIEEVEKGAKTRKDRGFWEKVKRAGGGYFRKRGARWEDRLLNNPLIPDEAKRIIKIINTAWMPGNTSHVEGTNQWAQQARAEAVMIRRSQDLKGHLAAALGYTTSNADVRKASAEYAAWVDAKNKNKNFKLVDPAMEEAMTAIQVGITDLTDGLKKIVEKGTGEKIGYVKDWFVKTLQFSNEALIKNKGGFIEGLVKGDPDNKVKGWTRAQATELYDSIVHGKPFDGGGLFTDFDLTHKSTKNRIAKLTDNSNLNEFMEKDLFKKLDKNIADMTRYSYNVKYLGKQDEKINMILSKLKREMGDHWDPEYALEVKEMIDANRGQYKPLKSKTTKEVIKNISFIGAITQLDTSMLASLPEAALVFNSAVREGGIVGVVKKAWKANKQHFKETSKEAASKARQFRGTPTAAEINPTADDIDLARESFYGSSYGSRKHGVLGAEDIERGTQTKWDSRREIILENFFRFNLLKPYTDATRVARLAIANDQIFSDLDTVVSFYNKGGVNSNHANDAYDRLRELNINPTDAAAQYKQVVQDVNEMRDKFPDIDTHQYIFKNFPDLYNTLELARTTFVDSMLAKPTIVDRPLWYSSPILRLGVQYQGFLSTFSAHILPRLYKQAKRGNPNLKYQAFATAATMVALAALGQSLKDDWKYGIGKTKLQKDAQHYQRAFAASGLLGTGERFLELIHPIYGSSPFTPRPGENALGQLGRFGKDLAESVPASGTVRNFYNAGESIITGNNKEKTLPRLVPLIGRASWFNDIYK